MVTAIGMEVISGDIGTDTHFITDTTTGPTDYAEVDMVATGDMGEMPDGVPVVDTEEAGKVTDVLGREAA